MTIQYFGNGKVFTSRDENTFTTAFAIEKGRFVWVGETAEINGDYIDLKGATVIPAFVEAHMHALIIARGVEQVPCLPPIVNSIEDIVQALKEKAKAVKPGSWIEGYGFDESKLAENRAPNIYDLDKACPNNPVIVMRSDYHSSVVNSMALKLAGITKDSPQVEGGEIMRFEDGTPNGFLLENARHLINKIKPPNSLKEDARLLKKYGDELTKMGFSTISDLMATISPENYYEVYKLAIEQGFKQKANIFFEWKNLLDNNLPDISKLPSTDQLKVRGIKIFMDGDIVSHTAFMKTPYPNDETRGFCLVKEQELLSAYEYVKDKNLQITIHAMGDQSIENILNTFENIKPWVNNFPSLRIEHGAVMSSSQIKRAAKLNIGVTHQPIFMYAEYKNYRKSLDDEKYFRTFPSATAYNSLKYFALSSDAPATTWFHPEDPFLNLEIAVNRLNMQGLGINESEKLPLEDALKAYTIRAAEIGGFKDLGAIDLGYKADFLILSNDIFKVPSKSIHKIRVSKTYLDGIET